MGLQNHKNAYSCFKELKYSTIVSNMFCSFPVNVGMPLYDCFYDVLISADVVVCGAYFGKRWPLKRSSEEELTYKYNFLVSLTVLLSHLC